MTPVSVLAGELETYERRRSELLGSALGKWVLIRGAEVAGTFETQVDAIQTGFRQFGNVPFLVKQVVPVEIPQYFCSNIRALQAASFARGAGVGGAFKADKPGVSRG